MLISNKSFIMKNSLPIHEKKFLDFLKKNLDEIKTVVFVALRLHKTQHQSNF